MAISLKHNFQSAVADSGDTTLVQPSNWNAEHDLTLATGRLIGRTTAGTGSAEEISVGTGLSLSAGTLAVGATTPQTNTTNTFSSLNTFQSGVVIGTGGITLTGPAGSVLQLGPADAASITAKFLAMQSIVAGTLDTAGASMFIQGSRGTGTGAGGSIIFQTAPAGTTGTAQNALVTALTIASSGSATFASSLLTGAAIRLNSNTQNTSALQFGTAGDAIISRSGAAALQFGAADSATPTAYTISLQSVSSGTSNTAGVDWTFRGSRGTGTGAGGSIIFQTAPAGTTGTAQNAAAERFRIGPAGQIGIGGANYGTSGQVLTSGGASAAPSWTTVSSGGPGGGMFYENDITLTADYTITTNKNAMTAGPVTINSGVTVTVPSTSTWTIV